MEAQKREVLSFCVETAFLQVVLPLDLVGVGVGVGLLLPLLGLLGLALPDFLVHAVLGLLGHGQLERLVDLLVTRVGGWVA